MTKKEVELKYLDRFKQTWATFPDGTIVEEECPDVLITTSRDTVGIELTELYQPVLSGQRPMQAQEGTEDKILRQAKVIYERDGGPPLLVYADFEARLFLSRSAVLDLANWLARCVRNSVAAPFDIVHIENEFDGSMPDEVTYIRIVKEARITKPLWSTARAGWEWTPRPADVQRIIDTKNQRASSYREKCDRVWLILIATGKSPSQFVEASSETLDHTFTAVFDSVFFFESFLPRVHELRIQRPDVAGSFAKHLWFPRDPDRESM